VELVHKGVDAVKLVAREQFDLVLMDVQMPMMSGIEATREIRRRGHAIPIVGLTGNAFISDRTECLRAGMNDFLAKPVTLEKLAQALEGAGLRAGAVTTSGTGLEGPIALMPMADTDLSGPAVVGTDPAPDAAAAIGVAVGGDIDAGLLGTLVRTLDKDTVLSLLDDLGAEADAMPAALEAAGTAGDAAWADQVLHSLKGAAATLGLAGAANRLQDLRAAGSIPAARAEEVRRNLHAAIGLAKGLVRRRTPSTAT
jgi:CheY-like chemotaxis protein/HPt (histidine-containing phosphotransfer) domain-containing protein